MVPITSNDLCEYCVFVEAYSKFSNMKKADKNKAEKKDPQTPPPERSEQAKEVTGDKSDAEKSEDERMDFGGLPDRDLKKNLGGCG